MAVHKLKMDGPPGQLSAYRCWCSCGQWESKMPDVGPWGRTTAKARIAQLRMAHGKHERFALQREREADQAGTRASMSGSTSS